MTGRLFVSQATLEAWVDQRRIDFEGDLLTLLSGDGRGRQYRLEPAVRIKELAGQGRDPHGLVGRVKSEARLRALGAERMGDSVVMGDVAYEVEVGFLAESSALAAAEPGSCTPAPPTGREPP